MRSGYFNGYVFPFGAMKKIWDEWSYLHNTVNGLSVTEPYTLKWLKR